jgi:hypothetical protein
MWVGVVLLLSVYPLDLNKPCAAFALSVQHASSNPAVAGSLERSPVRRRHWEHIRGADWKQVLLVARVAAGYS